MKKLENVAKAIVGVTIELSSAEQLMIELERRDIQRLLDKLDGDARVTDIATSLIPHVKRVQQLLAKISPDSMSDIYMEGEDLFAEPKHADEGPKVLGKINLDEVRTKSNRDECEAH